MRPNGVIEGFEEDAIVMVAGFGLLALGLWLLWSKASAAISSSGISIPSMGGTPNAGSDVMPGSPDEPENDVGYE